MAVSFPDSFVLKLPRHIADADFKYRLSLRHSAGILVYEVQLLPH
jgi:hypothetical protein